jgi:hypothetical protein
VSRGGLTHAMPNKYMPSFCSASTLQAQGEGLSISLDVRHCFVTSNTSTAYQYINLRSLDKLEILATSDLNITLSVIFDDTNVSSENVVKSFIAQHIVKFLGSNSDQLGINTISRVYIDENDGIPKCELSAS